ncbi:hypothetical protein D8674_026972 [Pyrus ussuriensis x Pyrus communis]|uniref:Uncharacterized protein n=1 Tax=Pyrus ussuriensis x Pyrus communis TaxID=2448454 RepID=A0A5N5I9G7_9ROSA|nr:hypothetical protein D8674_026972 [Pyrus ussuriensis x Pyrus communis]
MAEGCLEDREGDCQRLPLSAPSQQCTTETHHPIGVHLLSELFLADAFLLLDGARPLTPSPTAMVWKTSYLETES